MNCRQPGISARRKTTLIVRARCRSRARSSTPLRMEARRLCVWCRIGSVHIREFRASRGRRSALSATARLLGWCVAFGLTLSVSSVLAGPNGIVGGTHVGWIALGQTDQGGTAENRRAAEKWVKQAREAMKNGNLELAEYCIERAEKLNVKPDPLWAKFKDTPAKGARIWKRRSPRKASRSPQRRGRCPSCSTRTRPRDPNRRPIRTPARQPPHRRRARDPGRSHRAPGS